MTLPKIIKLQLCCVSSGQFVEIALSVGVGKKLGQFMPIPYDWLFQKCKIGAARLKVAVSKCVVLISLFGLNILSVLKVGLMFWLPDLPNSFNWRNTGIFYCVLCVYY